MDTSRLRWLLAALAAVVATAAVAIVRRRRDRIDDAELFEEEPTPPVELPAERTGSPADRGHRVSYALDMERLRGAQGFEPVVEYLTYVQSQRGEESHLLFVRHDDLDALAEQEGEPVTAFLQRLDQLGVVVSNN
ncbi:MAG: hypothetical protein R3343_01850 [Nitriliruptorales bacterium]|nr:hypothetical protein [Nitriliruptorales bacterium]